MKNIILSAIIGLVFFSCNPAHQNKNKSILKKTFLSHEDSVLIKIDSLKKAGFPIMDLHTHLKGGLTMEQLIEYGDNTGISYGVAANCGLKFPIENDSAVSAYYHANKDYPVYLAMQAEGREWVELFHPDTIALFDYVFTDAMTYSDSKGRRMRLWIKEEVFIDDEQEFMDYLANTAAKIIASEPIDIYVNPTFLPADISHKYNELWTKKRMLKVIKALKQNNVALEINSRMKIPSKEFILLAKEHQIKFTLGTNNIDANLGYLEYGLEMIEACKLAPSDFWVPKKRTE